MKNKPWPKTIPEAATWLTGKMSDKEKREILKEGQDAFECDHFGWGLHVRNKLGLWQGNENLLKACNPDRDIMFIHPDNCSGVILEAVWVKLKEWEKEKSS